MALRGAVPAKGEAMRCRVHGDFSVFRVSGFLLYGFSAALLTCDMLN